MIADLKPYPEYKESGLPWLGKVPEHWDTRVLKRLCSRSALYGANIPASNYVPAGLRFLRTTDITDDGTLRRGGVFVSQAAAQDYMLADGDLLVSRSGTIGRSLRYRATVHGPCAYAGYLVRFVPALTVSADYLFHFTKSLAFADFIRVSAVSSTIENVNGDKFANMPVTLPPPDEQAAIVRFLDWSNGRLERAIRAKRKVVALLNEQKQAIIHRAVTRGLDPSVPLKPSGILWLGDIPQHWEVLPLGRVMIERNEKNDPIKTNNILSLSLHDGVIPYADKRPGGNKAKEDLTAYKLAYPGDIVLNSMNVVVGSVGLSKYFGAVSPVYYMLRPRHSDDLVEYCDTIFQDKVFQSSLFGLGNGIMVIQSKATGKLNTIRMRIPMGELNRVCVPHPGCEEQEAIVEYLAQTKASFDQVIGRARREVELLQEYRTRLIADVVTGKLDVREAAARLPDEPLAPESVPEPEEIAEDAEV